MKRARIYGLLVGLYAGAWPFGILAVVRSGERWPTWVALALAIILSAAALRTPAAWAVGIAAGVVLSSALWAFLVGADWRLIPYVMVSFFAYYLTAAAAVIVSLARHAREKREA